MKTSDGMELTIYVTLRKVVWSVNLLIYQSHIHTHKALLFTHSLLAKYRGPVPEQSPYTNQPLVQLYLDVIDS